MQPTIIKIKFTPKIRPIEKDNTKYWLEIVPDVSDIQNLDTIEWKNDNKLIEYDVPVTYKVILKRGIDKNTVEKPEKIYYSCIDLRLLSATSTMTCSNVTKVISDNNIIRRKESSSTIGTVIRNQNKTKIEVCPEEQHLGDTAKELDIGHVNQLDTKKDSNLTDRNDAEILPDPESGAVVEDKQVVEQTCTECVVSKEIITDIIKTNQEKKRKLTIASICTLNTIDNPIYGDSKNSISKICLKNKTRNNSDYKISKMLESYAIHRPIYSDNNKLRKPPRERIIPELRVAHFMMTVQNEIMPLKILLNEIYEKCASLGLLWKPNVVPTCRAPHTIVTDKMKCVNYNEPKPRSNRVVYSIVFEE